MDTQHTLPFGTPAEVQAEVMRLCAISPGGGFVFNTIHNIQANVPIRNIVAMFDALKEESSPPEGMSLSSYKEQWGHVGTCPRSCDWFL